MLVAIAAYAVAGVSDLRTRRVPNALWIALFAYLLWSGVTTEGVLGAILLGTASFVAWWGGDMGGADVKGLALLPLAFPELWPVALLLGLTAAIAWFELAERDELPLFVPLFLGIVVTIAAVGLGM